MAVLYAQSVSRYKLYLVNLVSLSTWYSLYTILALMIASFPCLLHLQFCKRSKTGGCRRPGNEANDPCSTRGSHICVACRSVYDRDPKTRSVKIILDHLIAPFRGSWLLDFMGFQRTKHSHASVVSKKVHQSVDLVAQNLS